MVIQSIFLIVKTYWYIIGIKGAMVQVNKYSKPFFSILFRYKRMTTKYFNTLENSEEVRIPIDHFLF